VLPMSLQPGSSKSPTIEYTDQYITESKNQGPAKFSFSINKLSISLRSQSFQYTWSVYLQYACGIVGWINRLLSDSFARDGLLMR
jgi:hypothetical protein